MSDAMAIPQPEGFPEGRFSLQEVVEGIKDAEGRILRLYHRFHELNATTEKEDKRKKCNPLRDLKISANRAYQWARRAGCNADEARDRAIAATMNAAQSRYPSLVESGSLPLSVMAYIDLGYQEYSQSRKKRKKKEERVSECIIAPEPTPEKNETRSE
jgi:hypothetical protein